ncbi:MAG TPA: hypothetical protein EYQ84_07820 [Nitrospinaceae bacterium]|nr:hypothetical protein [Nitrospinaceae bacterium]
MTPIPTHNIRHRPRGVFDALDSPPQMQCTGNPTPSTHAPHPESTEGHDNRHRISRTERIACLDQDPLPEKWNKAIPISARRVSCSDYQGLIP